MVHSHLDAPLVPPPGLPHESRWRGRIADGCATFIVGDGEGHEPVTINLANTNALMVGGSFTGKTQCGYAIAAQAVIKGWDVIVCDYGARWERWMRRGLSRGSASAGLEATYPWLIAAGAEVQRRHGILATSSVAGWREAGFAPELVVFNEPSALASKRYGATADDEQRRTRAVSALRDLVAVGPRVGVHVLLIDNMPLAAADRAMFGEMQDDYFGVRVAAGRTYPSNLKALFPRVRIDSEVELRDLQHKPIWGRALVQNGLLSRPAPTQLVSVGRDQHDLDLIGTIIGYS